MGLLIIICGYLVISYSYCSIVDSLSVIKRAKNIEENPGILKSEIDQLKRHKEGLSEQLDEWEKRELPLVDKFSEIAGKFGLTLTGLSRKGQSIIAKNEGQKYQLSFTGRITSTLNALDYIENKLILYIETITIKKNEIDDNHIDMTLLIFIPEIEK
ncbi:MAG: hypothetical protein ABIJ45_12275 [Candidatus Zixiibacteriota bacterium]